MLTLPESRPPCFLTPQTDGSVGGDTGPKSQSPALARAGLTQSPGSCPQARVVVKEERTAGRDVTGASARGMASLETWILPTASKTEAAVKNAPQPCPVHSTRTLFLASSCPT